MSNGEDPSSDSSSARTQNATPVAVEEAASLPSLFDEFAKELIEAADATVDKIDVLIKEDGTTLSSQGKAVCRDLTVVINKSYDYTRAIENFTQKAKRGERQQHAFEEAAKENPNTGPMYEYIQDIQRHLGRAKKKYEKFRDSCKGVVERLGEVLEEIQKEPDKEGIKETTSQVTGGVLAGGAMVAGVGTGATVAVTGIGLSLAAGVPTLGIGTIVGLVITGLAAPSCGRNWYWNRGCRRHSSCGKALQ